MKKLILIVSIALFVHNLSAFPFRFTRLIKTDEAGKIEKTVDLIYDSHMRMPQQTKKDPTAIKKGILPEEWPALAIVERALLGSLRKLAAQPGPKIDFVLEWAESYKRNEFAPDFMIYAGKTLQEEFDHNKNKRIKFVMGDTYRWDIPIPISTFYFFLSSPETTQEGMVSDLYDCFNNMLEKANKDLNRIEPIIAPETYNNIRQYFQHVEKTIAEFCVKYKVSKSSEPLNSWRQGLGSMSEGMLKSLHYIVQIVMNLELLVRIFDSDSLHIIIYAGGNHCEGITEELITYYDFRKIINVGVVPSSDFYVTLMPSAWRFLEESPIESLKRPIECKVSPTWSNVEDIIDKANKSIKEGTKLLIEFIKNHFKCHVDVINAVNIESYLTLLHLAVQLDLQDLIDVLLHYNALTNIKEKYGRTPLFFAKSARTVQKLKRHAAKIDIRDDDGETSLHRALRKNRADVVKELLKQGANANAATDAYGDTPLYYAKSAEAVSMLLKHGAKINMRNRRNRTPLQEAIINERRSVVEELLKNGANPNEKFEYKGKEYLPYDFTKSRTIKKLLTEYAARKEGQPAGVSEEYIKEEAIEGD